jgi:hypothetical protein
MDEEWKNQIQIHEKNDKNIFISAKKYNLHFLKF